ncbi:MAG: hypothetical protein QOF90_338, partial [Acetobacteraceae bacterium]|nr:hypothetical protein [Acetobacteraceae bacterium]
MPDQTHEPHPFFERCIEWVIFTSRWL